ncbi:MAG: class I SAM-dependent RNA methyltransferase [Deltaproteobacteria bacterium]|nr:class I SAM-dependent RNA methyltransferase [Deltaproteobacteria bacterium]
MQEQRLRRGDKVEVTIDAVGPGGEGTAAHGDRVVHVPGLFPSERAVVVIEHVDRQGPRAWGRALELVQARDDRRRSPCRHHPEVVGRGEGPGCGGCPWMALSDVGQRGLRKAWLQQLELTVERIDAGAALGYRQSAKRVAFTDRFGALRLGSFAPRSHEGAAMTGCLVDHPTLAAAFAAIERAAAQLGIGAVDQGGPIRAVWGKSDGEAVLLTLIVQAGVAFDPDPLIDRVGPLCRVDGWSLAEHEGQGNAVRGGEARVLRGLDALQTTLAGAPLRITPLGFLQPNPEIAARAYRALLGTAGGEAVHGAFALDLFAGAGLTTALLRAQFDEVRPVESYPESAAALDVPAEDAAQATAALADAVLAGTAACPDLVVANPPRAGLGATLCKALLALGAPRIHIMSCNPATLRRDLDRLSGRYRLVELRAFDTLPQTPHVEVVAWLQLQESR